MRIRNILNFRKHLNNCLALTSRYKLTRQLLPQTISLHGDSGVLALFGFSHHMNIQQTVLDWCYTCNFFARFCCATLSRDKIAYEVIIMLESKFLRPFIGVKVPGSKNFRVWMFQRTFVSRNGNSIRRTFVSGSERVKDRGNEKSWYHLIYNCATLNSTAINHSLFVCITTIITQYSYT